MNRADKIGYGVSGALHAGVILWAVVGGAWFQPKPNEPTVISQVAVMSQEDFNAMMASAPKDAPQPTPAPQAPTAPQTPDATTPPETPAPDAQATSEPTPEALPDPAPQPDSQPDVSALTEPPAPADVAVAPPVMAPPVEVPSEALAPVISPRPKPKDVPRVAPEAAPAPPPDAKVSEQAAPQETPDAQAKPDQVVQKPKEAAAPPEATTEIVTEATKTDDKPETSAPLASPRPANKPKPPAPTQTAAADTPTKPDTPAKPAAAKPATPKAPAKTDSAAVTDALAAALGGEGTGGTGQAAIGPPITAGEKDALIVDVKQCWNVGALSSDALRTTVTLSVNMRPDGHPDIGSIKLVGSSGGTGAAVDQAFEAGKRAIVRCGSDGFPLPADKYARWKTIEIDFNPDKMRMK